jgi:hypothetical protein
MTALLGLLARHLLTGVGAALVAKGMPPTSAETLTGAVAILGGLAWSYIQKRLAAREASRVAIR